MIEIDEDADRRHEMRAANLIAAATNTKDPVTKAGHLRKAIDHLTAAKRFVIWKD